MNSTQKQTIGIVGLVAVMTLGGAVAQAQDAQPVGKKFGVGIMSQPIESKNHKGGQVIEMGNVGTYVPPAQMGVPGTEVGSGATTPAGGGGGKGGMGLGGLGNVGGGDEPPVVLAQASDGTYDPGQYAKDVLGSIDPGKAVDQAGKNIKNSMDDLGKNLKKTEDEIGKALKKGLDELNDDLKNYTGQCHHHSGDSSKDGGKKKSGTSKSGVTKK